MLEMTKPIHGKGKVVVGDSGFCVREGVVECHKLGVWFQIYIKKKRNWPRGMPGVVIDLKFDDYELGHCETLVANHDNIPFYVHCCCDSKYVSKIMSTHSMFETVQDHPTIWKVDGLWKSFKNTEPFSRYSTAKRRHDPIGLEEVWGTKWWPMWQFTFLCSVTKVNAVNSRVRGKGGVAKSQLEFRRQLAQLMMENTIDAPAVCEEPPMQYRRRSNLNHTHLKREPFQGSWDPLTCMFKRVMTDYVRLKCTACGKSAGHNADVLLGGPVSWLLCIA
jgi:hypothetical protein